MSKLASGSKILFVGDSITDADRRAPEFAPLGRGYVAYLAALLAIRAPQTELTVVNKGIGGQTVSHLLSRFHDDVVEHAPHVLVIQVGINDATRQLDRSPSLHCAPEAFGRVYARLLEEARRGRTSPRILAIPPFVISRDVSTAGSYRSELIALVREYVTAIRSLAASAGLELVDAARTFDDLIAHRRPDFLSEDGIHPNQVGHLALAEAVYRSLQEEAS